MSIIYPDPAFEMVAGPYSIPSARPPHFILQQQQQQRQQQESAVGDGVEPSQKSPAGPCGPTPNIQPMWTCPAGVAAS
jgi:hypothetical protein